MERANIQIMHLLKNAGAEVLFVTESGWGRSVADAVEHAGCKHVGIKLGRNLGLPAGPFDAVSLSIYWLRVSRSIRKIFREFRPTHLYLTNLTFFLFSLPLPGRKGVQTIFRLPNPPDLELHGWRRTLSDAIWRRLVIPRCDIFVCNSAYSRDRLREVAGPRPRVEVIYNSYPKRCDRGSSDAPVLSTTRFSVVYLGRIQQSKGVDLLYDAAVRLVAKYPHVDFYLAGEHSWQNPFAESLIERNLRGKLGDRIQFLDHINDTLGLLKQAQLHVCPSTSPSESFPNVLLEAKSAGLPSVVFETAGIPEAVKGGSEGLICREKTAECLADCIERYIEERDLLESHGAAARTSLDRYDERPIQKAWVDLVRNAG